MNIANLEVIKGLVANKKTNVPQLIQVSVEITDVESNTAHLRWHNVSATGHVDEPFASAAIIYSNAATWMADWIPTTHLIQGRIEALERLAEQGAANRLSHSMAYLLFANNLVDYAKKYRGIQSVVLHGLEAFADVTLTRDKGGEWTVPPYFIDSVAHLAGFVMNVSDANDARNNFFVTPGWGSMRFARPLVAGAAYRSYVKMIPTAEDPTVYLGDVYVLQDGVVVGMVGAIKFRKYPRILLSRFFSPPDEDASSIHGGGVAPVQPTKTVTFSQPKAPAATPVPAAGPVTFAKAPTPEPAKPVQETAEVSAVEIDQDSTAAKAMALVAEEGALDPEDLRDEASFAELGVDSLMSLVIAEKFREQLGVTVSGSLFLEYPTVGDLRAWLIEYYS